MKHVLCIVVLSMLMTLCLAGCSKVGFVKAADTPVMNTPIPTKAPDEDAPKLQGLKVFVTEGGGRALQPVFSPEVTAYTLRVQSDISSISLLPVAQDAQTHVTAFGKEIAS